MDKLQEWLGKKEAESPSPSLREKPANWFDKLRSSVQSKIRKRLNLISAHSAPVPEINQFEDRYENRDIYQYGEKYQPSPMVEQRYWSRQRAEQEISQKGRVNNPNSLLNMVRAASDVSDARRAEGIGLQKVWDQYNSLKKNWALIGENWDASGRIKQKLVSGRIKAAQGVRQKLAPNLTKQIEEGELSVYSLNEALWTEHMLSGELRRLGINTLPEKDRLFNHAVITHNEKAPFVPVSEFYASHPSHILLHGITGRGNGNNHVLNAGEKQAQDLFSLVIDEQPSISCTAFSPGSSIYANLYGAYGVVLNGGKIQVAEWQDAGSVALAKNLRLPHNGSGTKAEIKRDIEHTVRAKTKFNEFVVATPKVQGIYFIDDLEQAGVIKSDRFMEYEQLAQLAIGRGLPLYRLNYEQGLIEVDPNDLLKESTSRKAVTV